MKEPIIYPTFRNNIPPTKNERKKRFSINMFVQMVLFYINSYFDG
jgi:hypothetical protein